MKKLFLLTSVFFISLICNAQWGNGFPIDVENYDNTEQLREWINSFDNESAYVFKIPDDFECQGGTLFNYESDYKVESVPKTKVVGYNILQCEVQYSIVTITRISDNSILSKKAWKIAIIVTCSDPYVEFSKFSILPSENAVDVDIRGEAPVNEMGFKRIVSLRQTVILD